MRGIPYVELECADVAQRGIDRDRERRLGREDAVIVDAARARAHPGVDERPLGQRLEVLTRDEWHRRTRHVEVVRRARDRAKRAVLHRQQAVERSEVLGGGSIDVVVAHQGQQRGAEGAQRRRGIVGEVPLPGGLEILLRVVLGRVAVEPGDIATSQLFHHVMESIPALAGGGDLEHPLHVAPRIGDQLGGQAVGLHARGDGVELGLPWRNSAAAGRDHERDRNLLGCQRRQPCSLTLTSDADPVWIHLGPTLEIAERGSRVGGVGREPGARVAGGPPETASLIGEHGEPAAREQVGEKMRRAAAGRETGDEHQARDGTRAAR